MRSSQTTQVYEFDGSEPLTPQGGTRHHPFRRVFGTPQTPLRHRHETARKCATRAGKEQVRSGKTWHFMGGLGVLSFGRVSFASDFHGSSGSCLMRCVVWTGLTGVKASRGCGGPYRVNRTIDGAFDCASLDKAIDATRSFLALSLNLARAGKVLYCRKRLER